jgi:hypothetical protein
MRRLLGAIAAQMASLVVPGALASRLQIPASTLKRHLDLRSPGAREGGQGDPAWLEGSAP